MQVRNEAYFEFPLLFGTFKYPNQQPGVYNVYMYVPAEMYTCTCTCVRLVYIRHGTQRI